MEIIALIHGSRPCGYGCPVVRAEAVRPPKAAHFSFLAFLLLLASGPRALAAGAEAPVDSGVSAFVLDFSEALSGGFPFAPEGEAPGLPVSESRLALTDGVSRFLLAVSVVEGGSLEATAGLSSPVALAGPLELSGLARFLLDPAGEGFRLATPGDSPFVLDGSLGSSRPGLAFGGDECGAGVWVPVGEAPVCAAWLNARLFRSTSLGVLAWRFVETVAPTRSWVDSDEVAAAGPVRAVAVHASLGRASSRVGFAAGVTDALRGPDSAAARFETAFRSGAIELEAAAAARSGAWASPSGRQEAALLLRADLSFEVSDSVRLDARLVSSSGEGDGSELDLALGAEARPGPWRIALGVTREGPSRDLPRLGADLEAGFAGGALEAGLSCRIRADSAEMKAALADADTFTLRLAPSIAFRADGLALSAACGLEVPLAVAAPPGLEVSLSAALPLAGGSLSASLDFAVPSDCMPTADWNLRWKRRVRSGGV
ncbi:MAG: hypothetical protein JXA15_08550 [Spirochaetales bacterium]|nr:hypothetical protein [Spirochaetales bacterium]